MLNISEAANIFKLEYVHQVYDLRTGKKLTVAKNFWFDVYAI